MVCMPRVPMQPHTLAYARRRPHMQQCIHQGIPKATCILDGMHAACVQMHPHTLAYARPRAHMQQCIHQGMPEATCILNGMHAACAYAAAYACICKTQGPYAAVHTVRNAPSNLHPRWYACHMCICSLIRWLMQHPGPICSSAYSKECSEQPVY
jgi:hypothetical protein